MDSAGTTKPVPKGLRPWKKGESGNPSGMPKALTAVRDLAREHTVEAVEALVYWARQRNMKVASASVAAAKELLDRAWGKPQQPITGQGVLAIQVITGVPRAPDDPLIEGEAKQITDGDT